MRLRKTCSYLITLATLFLPALRGGSIIVPGGDEAQSNLGNSDPFNIGAFNIDSMRYQQVYASSEFSTAILITGIDFRVSGLLDGFTSTLPSIQMNLSTTRAAVDGLSEVFADNVGADDTVVFAKGPLTLSGAAGGQPGDLKSFDVHIAFTTPFLYDPSSGNLLLDVRNFGGGVTAPFSTTQSETDSTSRVASFDGNADRGNTDSSGLITQFDFDPVATPEPSGVVLAALGLVAIVLFRLRASS